MTNRVPPILLSALLAITLAVLAPTPEAAAAEDAAAPVRRVPLGLGSWTEPAPAAGRRLRRAPWAGSAALPRLGDLLPKAEAASGAAAATKTDAGKAGAADLAKQSQNPVSDLISVPFQNNTNLNAGPYERTQNILNIQPVVPIQISRSWNLVSRTIIPLINQPHRETPDGTTFGVGDINPTLFLTPRKPGKVIWGAGGTFFLPTATSDRLGTGKWSAGPSIVVLAMPGKWVLGMLASNYWSFAGSDSRPDVHAFFSQVFVNRNLAHGWFLSFAPIITANWNAASDERWTVPFGGGIGRVTKFGKQPVSISVQAYYNAVRPTDAADWQIRLQFTLLFPKK